MVVDKKETFQLPRSSIIVKSTVLQPKFIKVFFFKKTFFQNHVTREKGDPVL